MRDGLAAASAAQRARAGAAHFPLFPARRQGASRRAHTVHTAGQLIRERHSSPVSSVGGIRAARALMAPWAAVATPPLAQRRAQGARRGGQWERGGEGQR